MTNLELSALHIMITPREGGRGGHANFICAPENIKSILARTDRRDNSYQDGQSGTGRSFITGIVYGSMESSPRKEIEPEEYFSLKQPETLPEKHF